MKKIGCKISIKSFDSYTIEYSIHKIKKMAALAGVVSIVGPIPLPTNKKRFTVLRSPHVYKKSREQFEMATHKRLLVLKDTSPSVIQYFLEYLKKNIPIGVGIQLVEYTYETFSPKK